MIFPLVVYGRVMCGKKALLVVEFEIPKTILKQLNDTRVDKEREYRSCLHTSTNRVETIGLQK